MTRGSQQRVISQRKLTTGESGIFFESRGTVLHNLLGNYSKTIFRRCKVPENFFQRFGDCVQEENLTDPGNTVISPNLITSEGKGVVTIGLFGR